MVREITIAQCNKMIAQAGGEVWRKQMSEKIEVIVFPMLGKLRQRIACIDHTARKALTMTMNDFDTSTGMSSWLSWCQSGCPRPSPK